MAKPMTKSKIVAALAEKVDIPKKRRAAYLEALAATGAQGGEERLHDPRRREAGRAQLQGAHGPQPADRRAIKIPARRRLKFVVAKAAKDAALGGK